MFPDTGKTATAQWVVFRFKRRVTEEVRGLRSISGGPTRYLGLKKLIFGFALVRHLDLTSTCYVIA